MRRFIKFGLVFVLVTLPLVLFSSVHAQSPPPGVVVTTVKEKDIAPENTFVGRIEAIETVDIRARVEGFLEQRLFQEGAEVKKGDLLYVLEKASYQIAVAQSKADLAGAEATLKNARSDSRRQKSLSKKKLISAAALDSAEAREASALANVMQAKARLQKTELDLSYTSIHSPIDGRIGRSQYSVGNLVNTNSGILATISSSNPIYVSVPISDKIILQERRKGLSSEAPVTPSLILSDGKPYEFEGRFDFINTEVNQNTDSVLTRAIFANPNRLLTPGQFVSVVVRRKQVQKALVIPQASVQKDQQGYFTLIVNRANKVEIRRIQVGDQINTEWIVTDGLLKGQRVIVEGVQKVRPDMLVNPFEDGA